MSCLPFRGRPGGRVGALKSFTPTEAMITDVAVSHAPAVGSGTVLREKASKAVHISESIAGSSSAHSPGSHISDALPSATNEGPTSISHSPPSHARSYVSGHSKRGFERRSKDPMLPKGPSSLAHPPYHPQIGERDMTRHIRRPSAIDCGTNKHAAPLSSDPLPKAYKWTLPFFSSATDGD